MTGLPTNHRTAVRPKVVVHVRVALSERRRLSRNLASSQQNVPTVPVEIIGPYPPGHNERTGRAWRKYKIDNRCQISVCYFNSKWPSERNHTATFYFALAFSKGTRSARSMQSITHISGVNGLARMIAQFERSQTRTGFVKKASLCASATASHHAEFCKLWS